MDGRTEIIEALNTVDSLLGIEIGVSSLDDAVDGAVGAIDRRDRQIAFACANSNSMNVARRDSEFREALKNADQLVADGVGVTLIARLAGKSVGPRIIGQQYYEALMNRMNRRGHGRVFFFGSSERVLELIRQRFALEYPNLTLCGTISPPYGDWPESQNDQFVETINKAAPDVLWVGMTAPKQEKWVQASRGKLDAPVLGSIGAVFDFFAGTVKESPRWVRSCGLEAPYRLFAEPRRLWRRVLVSNVTFIGVGFWCEVLGIRREKSPS